MGLVEGSLRGLLVDVERDGTKTPTLLGGHGGERGGEGGEGDAFYGAFVFVHGRGSSEDGGEDDDGGGGE